MLLNEVVAAVDIEFVILLVFLLVGDFGIGKDYRKDALPNFAVLFDHMPLVHTMERFDIFLTDYYYDSVSFSDFQLGLVNIPTVWT